MRLGPTKVRNLRNVTMRNVIWANRLLNEHIGSHLKHSVNTFILFIKYHKTGFITNSLNAMSSYTISFKVMYNVSDSQACGSCEISLHISGNHEKTSLNNVVQTNFDWERNLFKLIACFPLIL